MVRIKLLIEKIDQYLQERFKQYSYLKMLKQYKMRLQKYRAMELKNIVTYEKQWKDLKRKNKRIALYGIQFVSIGETVPRLFNLIQDMDKEDEKVKYIVLPTFFDYYIGGIYNWRMFDIFAKKVYFIRESNIDFWTYVFLFHINELDLTLFNKYKWAKPGAVKVELYKPLLPFSKEEVLEGEEKLSQMGVKGDFICLNARESNVKTEDFGKRQGYESRCRNCDINTFVKTSKYFGTLNIQSVRLGKYEKKKCDEESIIDYTNYFYDEFMDFYLMSKCKFLVSCDTGLVNICGNWGSPVLLTNAVNLCYSWESWPDTGYDMYMPKKFYSRIKKRYLNLYEMLDAMNECIIFTSSYIAKGIILEDNTEDEILEAAKELNERIENRWIESENEKKVYEKYWRIMNQWERDHKYVKARGKDKYTMCFSKISYSYLRNNLYLLETT